MQTSNQNMQEMLWLLSYTTVNNNDQMRKVLLSIIFPSDYMVDERMFSVDP